ncbi:MAG: O-acetyl-ADP-ribose deacetylase [Deltaproteobacteria bacterium]
MERRFGSSTIRLLRGDITGESVDAIVNAANSTLLGGGGVDGAIHRAGGPEILAQCREIRSRQGGCPPGEAVLTTGGNLPARFVIHTVGPVWRGGDRGESETLASCYRNCLRIAAQRRFRTLSFPSISTGAYRYPVDAAARVALKEVASFLESAGGTPEEVRFVLFDEAAFKAYREALREITPGASPGH